MILKKAGRGRGVINWIIGRPEVGKEGLEDNSWRIVNSR